MNAKDFIDRQLGTAGWAPIHEDLAKALCPDIHQPHIDIAAHLRNPQQLPRLFPGAALYQAQVEGFGKVVMLSRSQQFLAERMGWLGVRATEVSEYQEEASRPAVKAVQVTGDPLALLHANIATKEPPRPCKVCGNVSGGQTCLAAQRGELEGAPADYRPDLAWPRRCLAYAPSRIIPDSPAPSDYDRRTGRELWPEIV